MADLNRFGEVQDLTASTDPIETVGAGQVLAASFRQSTSVGSIFSAEPVARVYDSGNLIDDAFTLEQIDGLDDRYQPYAERFVGATRDGAVTLKRNIDMELRDRETIEMAGMIGGFAADVAVQFVDPLNYLPFGGATLKGASYGSKLYRSAKAGVIGAAIQEPFLYGSQETRTAGESFANIGASAAFGLAIGQGAHLVDMGRARWGEPAATVRGAAVPSAADIAPLRAATRKNAYDQLIGAGRSEVEASSEADLWGSAYEAFAARPDVDPVAAAEAFRVKIEAEAVTPVGAPDAARSVQDVANSLASKDQVGNLELEVNGTRAKAGPLRDADGVTFNQSGRVITDTSEFRNWFGDSKVVDESGAPLVVYHGTNANAYSASDFQAFNTNGERSGAYFSTDGRVAETYGEQVYASYVSIKNPLIVDANGAGWSSIEFDTPEAKNTFSSSDQELLDVLAAELADFGDAPANVSAASAPELVDVDFLARHARNLGHDGLIVRNVKDGPVSSSQQFPADTVVPFDPTQIKSVYNRGTFDPSDPRILYQGGVSDPKARALMSSTTFNQSSVIEVDGVELPLNKNGTVTLYHGTDVAGAAGIVKSGRLVADQERRVYLTTDKTGGGDGTGYGDGTVIAVDVRPNVLALDDEFPDGRADFAIEGASVPVLNARVLGGVDQGMPGESLVTDDVVAFAQSDDVMPDVGLKAGKSAKFWRGVNESSGGNSAEYGEGLYVAGSKSEAQSYVDDGGRLIEMDRSDLPQNPIRFRDNLDWQRWRDRVMGEMGLRGAREHGPQFPDISQLIKRLYPDVDGVQISTGKDAIFVNYGGDRVFEQQNRGSIEFPQGGVTQGQTVIKLMAGADQSTFLHESGHFFLQVMNDFDATMGDKSPFGADLAEIRKWTGLKKGEAFTRDAHEQFARGFEQYLRDGKAPSPALQRAFDAFKDWLIKVYASAAQLNVEVSPEMARVYDRLLVPDVSEMAGSYPARKSVGAAASDGGYLVDVETGEYRMDTATDYALRNAAARIVEKVTVPITPNDKVRQSPLASIKRIMGNLVEDMRDTEASRQGIVTTAISTELKIDRDMVEGHLYNIMGKNGKRFEHSTLDRDAFNRRVLDAVANPDAETDADVRKVADALYGDIIAPFEKQMRTIGMLAETQKWTQDGRYAPHSWSAAAILENLSAFRAKMGERIRKSVEVGYKIAIDKAVTRQQNSMREVDELEVGKSRRREEFDRRNSGDEIEISEDDLRSLVMQARNKPADRRPPSLRQFVINRGGIWRGDDGGEIAAMQFGGIGFLKKNRIQKSAAGDNGGGMMVDDMREAAVEAGYLRDDATINDFIDALDQDVRGQRVYSQADENEVLAWNAHDEFLEALDQMGIDPSGKRILRATTDSQKDLMSRTMDAMDGIDDARIAQLKERFDDLGREAAGLSDTINDPRELDAEVDIILDQVQGKLTGEDAIWSEDLSLTIERAGPLNKRTIDVRRSEFSEFMDNDVMKTIGGHMHRMVGEYHLTKRFGRADLKADIASIRREAETYAETLTGKDRVDFTAQLEKDIAMLQVTRDQLRGTHAKGQTGKVAGAARFMSALSYSLQLGDVVTSSLGDMMRPAMVHGAAHVLRHGWPALQRGMKSAVGKMDPDDFLRSDLGGVAFERIASSRVMAMMDLDADYLPNSKAERLSNNMAGWATRLSLMDRWNQLGKHIAGDLFMARIGEMSHLPWADLKPKDQGYLSLLRISQNQWPVVADAIQAHGSKDRGIWRLNLNQWPDQDLARLTRAAMRKDVDSVIVTPDLGDRVQSIGGADFTGPVGKMLLQYKSFWISGHQRIMLRAAQNPDVAATASGALAMVVVGMMIDEVKAWSGGYELSDNIGTRVLGGLDRSGVIPLWMEANNMLEKATALPLAYRAAGGVGKVLGAEDGGNTSTRYASRNVVGSLLGPSAGVVTDAVRVVGDTSRELQGLGDGITPGTITAIKNLTPFHNIPVVRQLINLWAAPALKDLAG